MKHVVLTTNALMAALALCSSGPASAQAGTPAGATTRLSVSSTGAEAGSDSASPAMTPDGRYTIFQSFADNLVPGQAIGVGGIFLRDRSSGSTVLVSVDSAGHPANQGCGNSSAITPDGRYVAFSSFASNLAAGDTNGVSDIFVHDLVTGLTTRRSVSSSGGQGNNDSTDPAISADGRYVAFTSLATNLVPGDINFAYDVFVHDRVTGKTVLASVSSTGAHGSVLGSSYAPVISADGRWVAFPSLTTNLVPGDSNHACDVFVHDMLTGSTELDSVDSGGVQGNELSFPTAITPDGRFLAFHGAATNLVPGDTNGVWDVFVHDRVTGITERVSVDSNGSAADVDSFGAAISSDGRHVAFTSSATHLVPEDTNGWTDVFVHDRVSGSTERVSVDSAGMQGDYWAAAPAMSDDGRFVAFESASTNLVPGDTNGAADIFLRDRQLPGPWSDLGHALAGTSGLPGLAGGGSLAAGSHDTIALSQARPLAPAWLVTGLAEAGVPLKGGLLVPEPLILLVISTDASGAFSLPFVMPSGAPAGIHLMSQAWIADAEAVHGFAASNAIQGTTP